eukprot:gb/GECG01014182.1/.p1 GENE.gb/GECG01014182.1/~~gb/GECG01014182.1/.p1  ORF type:complete len:760 (+),score=134.44 gb/GECG01014182.1/:1-2280(+)
MERLHFHSSTGEDDEHYELKPLNSESDIMQELKPENTRGFTEKAYGTSASTVGGAPRESVNFGQSSTSTTYDPSKPGIKSLALAKEAREQEKNDRIAQLEADLKMATNSRDRALQSLRNAQDVKSAAISLLKAHKSELNKQQQSDPLAWSRALEHAQQFIQRVENVLSGDGQRTLTRHENAMKKVCDAMNELRSSVAKMEAVVASSTNANCEKQDLDKEAMAKEIDMLRAENASLRERNALVDFNSEDYHSIHYATDVHTQLRQRSAQLAATKSQLHRSQQTTKTLVATIRQMFPDQSHKSDKEIIENSERDASPALGYGGNDPPRNRSLQGSSGGTMQLPSETASHLQRLAQSTSLKRQTSLKQLFEDFSIVPIRKPKRSTTQRGKALPPVASSSSSSPLANQKMRENKSSKTRENTGKNQEVLQEQINVLADEVVRLCYLLGRAEVQSAQEAEKNKAQTEKKSKKKSKTQGVCLRWKREMEERLETIEACFGESSSAVLSVLSIAQDSLRMITGHCAEAENRLSAKTDSVSTENQQLRDKIAKLERVLHQLRKPSTTEHDGRTHSRSQLSEKKSYHSVLKKPSESSMKSSPLRSTKSFASPAPLSETKSSSVHPPQKLEFEDGNADPSINKLGSNNASTRTSESGGYSDRENAFNGSPTYSEDTPNQTLTEHISTAASHVDDGTSYRLNEIRREGEQLLPELKQWENDFHEAYGRNPTQSEKFSGPLGRKYERFKELAKEMKEVKCDSNSQELENAS